MTTSSVKGFRFDEYEDVFEGTGGALTYAQAEPMGWAHLMSCQDYRSNGDGTYSVVGDWYGMTAEELQALKPASMAAASAVVGAEFMRSFALDPYEADEDESGVYTDFLLDVASCHLLEHGADDSSLVRAGVEAWTKALQASGIDAI